MHARARAHISHMHTQNVCFDDFRIILLFYDITKIARGVLYNFQDYNLFAASGVFLGSSILLRVDFVSGALTFQCFARFARAKSRDELCGEQTERYRFQFYVE